MQSLLFALFQTAISLCLCPTPFHPPTLSLSLSLSPPLPSSLSPSPFLTLGHSVLHISWLMVALSRIFVHHEAKSIIKWGVRETLDMPLDHSPLLVREHWQVSCHCCKFHLSLWICMLIWNKLGWVELLLWRKFLTCVLDLLTSGYLIHTCRTFIQRMRIFPRRGWEFKH